MGKHTLEDEKAIQEYENYIARRGVDRDVINAYAGASNIILCGRKDRDYGLKVSARAKELIEKQVLRQTGGGTVWDLEKYQQDNNTDPYEILNKYYDILRFESEYWFESFMLYMERKRPYKERFYQPREIPLRRVANGIQDLVDDKLDELFVNCPSRVGKAEPLDALVLTEKGFKQMGEINVGDKVITADGTTCNVTGVFPQGVKDVYRVNFTDETSVECCKEHLWRVQTIEDRRIRPKRNKISQTYRVVETQEMIGHLQDSKGANRYSVDYVEPIKFPKKELKIPPYVLGALIGDGSLTSGNCAICNPEKDVIEKVKKLCNGYAQISLYKSVDKCPRYSLTGKNIRKDLRFYGLLEKKSYEKSIPFDYLHSDVKDRIELLQGLCDTDGSVCLNSTFVDYSTSSEQLANDIIYLVRSLGGRATLDIGNSHYTKNEKKFDCRKRYRVTLSLNGKIIPVSSKKHLLRYKNNKKVTKKFITSIEFSRKAECQCIMVDSPSHLYVTNDFVVTHNTQIVKMGYLWYGSKNPEMSNLYTAYSDKITSGFYDGLIELITDPTYTYAEIFPQNVEKKLITDGKDLTLDLIRKKTYPTFTMRSIYGTLNGACDCSGLAVADDLFSGIEEALSIDRQVTVWGKFDNNFMKRLKRKAKLINMGTRWAPKDVQGRRMELLESNEKYKNRRWSAIIIPALNENDESNFDYPYDLGYSTEDYHMIRASFEENDDMASWDAQDMQSPTERHGQLFPTDAMLTFNPEKDLPDREPDRIFAAVDEAFGGGDYVAMPVCYQYNDCFYIMDAVFDNGDKKITRPLIVDMCMKHKVRTIKFEETKTTAEYREWCEAKWKENGFSINSFGKAAPNNVAKKDRIFNKAPEIKEMYFLEPSFRSKPYNDFLKNMRDFKMEGRVKHDDAPDSMAQLCEMKFERRRKTIIMASPI